MLKRQFQWKFENMKSGQSDKDEEHSDCRNTGSGKDTGSGRLSQTPFLWHSDSARQARCVFISRRDERTHKSFALQN